MSKTYGKRTCVWCGKEFEATHPRQKSCKADHYVPCPDCGIPVKVVDSSYAVYLKNGPKRCKSCAVKYSSQVRKSKSVQEKQDILNKRKSTNLEKYGVEYASQSKEIQQKVVQTNLAKYGVERPLQSKEIYSKMEGKLVDKYGVINTFQLPESEFARNSADFQKATHKRETTMLERYGVENIMQSDIGKDRFKASMQLNHNVEYPQQCSEIREKTKNTFIENYGVEYPLQHSTIMDKYKNTLQANYGVTQPMHSKVVKDKHRQSCIDHYGVEYPMQSELVKHKSRIVCIEKYGSNHYISSNNSIQSKVIDPSKFDAYTEFKKNPSAYILKHYEGKPTCQKLSEDVGVTDTTIYDILIRSNCRHLATYYESKMEQEVVNTLKSIDSNIQIVRNDRRLVAPQELDIYLPEYNIAIECNPTYTHNSSFDTVWGNDKKSYRYHQYKTEACDNIGIRLIHIYGYQWSNRRDVVISMLRNVLHKNEFRIFARDTIVKEVPSKEAKSFLNDNHLQGATASTVRLGLYHGDRLISLMTFSKPRHTSGHKASYDSNTWELTRFCTLLNTNCIGGASKLFKHFLKIYQPSMVTSFSDRSTTSGNLYRVLGFTFDSYVNPGYVWVNVNNDQFYTRVTCQKSNLPKLFNELDLDITNQTETQIMESHGYARVYNSGLIKWIYR